jgi:RNA polymerase sigma-70 factor (ECF subfamily)
MANTTVMDLAASGVSDFADLMRGNQSMVFSIAYHFQHDRPAAEEVAQDAFLQLYRKLPSLESDAHVTAWLRKVTCHRCIDYARRRRQNLALDDISEPASEPAPGDPLLAHRLQRMVASLPPKARAVVVLRYQEDLEPEEIARVLGWRLNTVKSQLHRSLKMLRQKFDRASGESLS